MCNSACVSFVIDDLKYVDIEGKKILEIGSYNVNGSVRGPLLARNPIAYVGIDLVPGPDVDMVCDVYDVVKVFGEESFDIVISTEMLEHVEDWRKAINNMKRVCKQNGHLLITTRSKGFPLHDYPSDYWRFEIEDMLKIFSDSYYRITRDRETPGVFVHARIEKINVDLLDNIKLYNINSGCVE